MSLKKEKKTDIIQEYGIDFVARFACLYEGVNVAGDRAEKLGYTGNTNVWIKPTALQKYIDERYLDMKYQIEQEMKGVQIDEIYPWSEIYE
jgi:hypothetical protein|tara:strand:- start:513 stop:785 length:273 start_codon:yes stop_codon:yes gene_type:complete